MDCRGLGPQRDHNTTDKFGGVRNLRVDMVAERDNGHVGHDADAARRCELRSCPTFDVKKYLHQLQQLLPYVPPISERTIKSLHKAQDYKGIIRLIKRAMNIEDVIFVVHWVPTGAANKGKHKDAVAWVEMPHNMPRYGSAAFKEMKINMYFRRSFFEQAYDQAAIVVAHEFSHVVLESIEHPLRRCEKAVDLTAMLLGFRQLCRTACYKEWRTGNRIESVTLGYLTTQEVERANQILIEREDWHQKTRIITSLRALVAGLRGLRRREPVTSRVRSWKPLRTPRRSNIAQVQPSTKIKGVGLRAVFGSGILLALTLATLLVYVFSAGLLVAYSKRNDADVSARAPPDSSDVSTDKWLRALQSNQAATISSATALDIHQIEDAKRVQRRLIELGFLADKADGKWGRLSQQALHEFRAAQGLGNSDTWDATAQQYLFAATAVRSPLKSESH
jgi:hypothetical protein